MKKVAPKKAITTTPSKKGKFVAKKIGANLIATVEGTTERYSRKVTMEESSTIMQKMEIYNKRPSKIKKEELIGLLTPEATKKKKEIEQTEVKAKGLKKLAKKEIKKAKSKNISKEDKDIVQELEASLSADSSQTNVDKLQAVLNKFKKKEEIAPVAAVTQTPRGGENYRRY